MDSLELEEMYAPLSAGDCPPSPDQHLGRFRLPTEACISSAQPCPLSYKDKFCPSEPPFYLQYRTNTR